jgi:hypothetical protein
MKPYAKTQTMRAYAECNGKYEPSQRKLMFRAERPVSVKRAIEIMAEAVPRGYNEFEAEDVLGRIAAESPKTEVYLAREHSVCLYLKVPEKDLPVILSMELGQDEKGLADPPQEIEPNFPERLRGTVRFWWD